MHRAMIRFGISAVLSLATLATLSSGQTQAPPSGAQGVRSEMLVSTQWLAEHLKDPDVVVLHITDSQSDYKRGHIPGAHFLAASKVVANDVGGLNAELPPVQQLQNALSEAGVGDNTRVILYATNWMPYAARVYYTLDYLGHGAKTSLLDGGIEQWLAEDRPTVGEAPKFAAATFTPRVHENARALLEEVEKTVASTVSEPPEQVLDARPHGRYAAGHLPGAVDLYWEDTLVSKENPVFQSPEKLRALYAARGIVPGKKIVTYCEVGLQASHAYFLAKYLGYDAAMYDGSYQEWSAKKLTVVKGDATK